jgi:phenylacetate-coenzyme A ligase PaaK-like adenylate-forming protein
MSAFDDFRQRAQRALFGSMPDHIDRLSWDAARIRAEQHDRCRELLSVAIERSPFHARRLRGIDPATFELDDLIRVPVMTKAEMMEHFDDLVTDRRVTTAAVAGAIEATTTEPQPIAGEFVVITSGGSSGRRGTFVFDVGAFATFGATLMRPALARAAGPSGAPAGLFITMVGAASPIHATGCAVQMMEGSPVPFVSVPVTLPLDEMIARLEELQPPLLYGYPSMLARLAHERRAGRLDIAPSSVTSTSETLRPDLRRAIAEGFEVPIVNTFGSSEGLVGVSPPDDPWIVFADDCCIAEPVDEHDRPVAPGQPSAAVLVTNLFNHVQPLIRYRIEDRLVVGPPADGHGHLRAEVEGRAGDILRFGRLDVHPLVITTRLAHNPAIVDYQVRQLHRGVAVDVVAPGGVDAGAVAAEIRDGLDVVGLPDAEVVVSAVGSLPRDPRTGKLALFVPLAS